MPSPFTNARSSVSAYPACVFALTLRPNCPNFHSPRDEEAPPRAIH